ncbi:MAG: DNA polymerase III subunit beta [bacterium]
MDSHSDGGKTLFIFITKAGELRSIFDKFEKMSTDIESVKDEVLIYCLNDQLRIRKTTVESEIDIGLSISNRVGAGSIIVPFSPLNRVLKSYDSNSEIQFSLTRPTNRTMVWTLMSEGIKICGYGHRPRRRPEKLKKESDWNTIENWNLFARSLQSVLPFVSKDEARIQLSGIFLNSHWLCATNGHILTKEKSNIEFHGFILPENFARILCSVEGQIAMWRIVKKEQDSPVSIAFFINDQFYQTELIDAEYPDYNRVIPEKSICCVTLNRSDMLFALRKLIPITQPLDHQVTWHVDQKSRLCVKDKDTETTGEIPISGSHSGEKITIGIDYLYALTLLESLSSDRVTAKFTSPYSPIVWTDEEDNSGRLRLLMPIKLD